MLINGIFVGIGTGLGSFVAISFFVKHIEQKMNKIIKGKNHQNKK